MARGAGADEAVDLRPFRAILAGGKPIVSSGAVRAGIDEGGCRRKSGAECAPSDAVPERMPLMACGQHETPVRGSMLRCGRALVLCTAAVLAAVEGAAAAPAAPVAADPAAIGQEAAAFVTGLVDRVLALLRNPSLGAGEREARLRELARQNFDLDGIARFLAGRAWRTASEAERQAFRPLLEDYVMRVYAARIGVLDKDLAFVVRAVRADDGVAMVLSEFVRPNAPPVRADWRVVTTLEGLHIADVSVEGVSLAITQRDEFAAVIQRNGGTLAGLMNVLRQRIAEAEAKP
jgi:phospholipid transport system substrate-binding protein